MHGKIKKHPLNVSGEYYVDYEACLDYECCVYEAPNNFKMDRTLGALTFSNNQTRRTKKQGAKKQ